MKKSLIALAAIAAFSFAHAEENPAVAAAKSANDTIKECVTATVTAIGQSTMSEGTKALMIKDAPAGCRAAVVIPAVRQAPGTGEMMWDGFKFVAGLVAQYKGQALIWNAVTGITDRALNSTDNAVNQGFNTANQGMGAISGIAGQTLDKIPNVEPSDAAGN